MGLVLRIQNIRFQTAVLRTFKGSQSILEWIWCRESKFYNNESIIAHVHTPLCVRNVLAFIFWASENLNFYFLGVCVSHFGILSPTEPLS